VGYSSTERRSGRCWSGRKGLVTGAGGQVVAYSSAYRPQSYQDHLFQIAETVKKLQQWLEQECALTRLTALNEKQTHNLGPVVARYSKHSDGLAFDVTVSVPAGYALDQQANEVCHLVRDELPLEAWHWHYIGQ